MDFIAFIPSRGRPLNLDPTPCPNCNANALSPETYSESFEYQGRPLKVDGLQSMRCANCGADPVLNHQVRANQIRIADAKRASDGLLSGAQIRELRERLGLSQSRAAEIFGGGVTAFSKYERGQVIQSEVMDKLLRAALAIPQVVPFLQGTYSSVEVVTYTPGASKSGRAQHTISSMEVTLLNPPIPLTNWAPIEFDTTASNDDYVQIAGTA